MKKSFEGKSKKAHLIQYNLRRPALTGLLAIESGLRKRKLEVSEACFGEPPLQRTRSDGQAFKPAREPRALPGSSG